MAVTEVSVRDRLPRDVSWMLAPVAVWVTFLFVRDYGWGVDSTAYWGAWRGGLYDQPPAHEGAYLYSPLFAQLIWPFTALPSWAFAWLVALLALGTLWWLTTSLTWLWRVPLLLACSFELATGNINWLLAIVAAYGLRHPWLWAVPALTKITPCVGPVWFLARGEWRALAASLAGIGVAVAVSAAFAPSLWLDWWHFLVDNGGRANGTLGGSLMPPLAVRLPVALLLLVVGARRDRPWVIPVSMILLSPVFGLGSVAILAALPRLAEQRRPARAPAPGGATMTT